MFVRLLFIIAITASPALADQMVYSFKNPQFSGDGFSSHVLTIENQETTRKKQIETDKKAQQDAIDAASRNTNLSKFLNNLESRIYAQLSLQLSNDMFSGGGDTGTLSFQGSTITWIKDSTNGLVNLTIIDDRGNRTELEIPIGSFKF
jgi:hypothetical protein